MPPKSKKKGTSHNISNKKEDIGPCTLVNTRRSSEVQKRKESDEKESTAAKKLKFTKQTGNKKDGPVNSGRERDSSDSVDLMTVGQNIEFREDTVSDVDSSREAGQIKESDANQSDRNDSEESTSGVSGCSSSENTSSSENSFEATKKFSKKYIEELLYKDGGLLHRASERRKADKKSKRSDKNRLKKGDSVDHLNRLSNNVVREV